MRDIVFGAIGVVWGSLILLSAVVSSKPEGEGAYASGRTAGLVFAVLLVSVGGFYLWRGLKARR